MNNIVASKLIDQMGFSSGEIARRLHLLNFTSEDAVIIKKALPFIEHSLQSIIEEYYDYQLNDPEMAVIIGDADTLARLKGYLSHYVTSLFAGVYDEDYVNTRLRVGKVHKRLDVRPKIYIKAFSKLQSLLEQEIEASCFVEDAEVIKSSLQKILLFDAELVFDAYVETYLTEMQSATLEVEKYASGVGIKIDNMFHRLYERSQKDNLTGLHNRRSLYDFLKRECRVAERHHLSFVLVYMDLNGFKAINDVHGHQAGDSVLAQVGKSMLACTRAVDIAARYGGDEFCLVLPRSSLADVDVALTRLTKDFDENCRYPVTFSMGVVQVGPTKFEEPEELIRIADLLMYEAKQRAHADGGHHWHFEGKSGSPKNI
ncbi:MAG: GGDEF domain-containing protein [Sneathiella sp.]